MKILNADWEKRNLGVSCTEITVELTDVAKAVRTAIGQIGDDYVVVKVPVPRVDVMLALQEAGYAVIEVAIGLHLRLQEAVFPRLYQRY